MSKNKKSDYSNNDLKNIISYIEKKWFKFTYKTPNNFPRKGKKPSDVLYLPKPYIVPNDKKFDVMFYWDSFFTIQALKLNKKNIPLIKGIVENCFYQIDVFGKVLNANKKKWSDRSQLPFLTSMIREVYNLEKDKKWLSKAYKYAKIEYKKYWMNKYHKMPNGLSRFYCQYPDDKLHTREYKSRAEASWDMSPRFDDEDIHDLIPIDLNINLYKYEKDFAYFDKILNPNKVSNWNNVAKKRKVVINSLCWDKKDKLFYDYNFKLKEKKKIKSLAGYVSLFFRFASKKQANDLIKSLKLFKLNYCYAACDKDYGFKNRQWNWPYVWAPLIYILYEGLNNYKYTKLAKKVSKEFIELVINNFKKTGYIWEKYNGDSGTPGDVYDRYKNQEGFSWTNAVFEYLVYKEYGKEYLN
ncbi:MAG: trehalase family glycosidase [Candidatus Woesearchaeota archaeon]